MADSARTLYFFPETFLELLEPYILKDMLGSLPPEVIDHIMLFGY